LTVASAVVLGHETRCSWLITLLVTWQSVDGASHSSPASLVVWDMDWRQSLHGTLEKMDMDTQGRIKALRALRGHRGRYVKILGW